MSKSYTAFVTVEVQVTNVDSESEARRIIFASLAASAPSSKGRPSSGAKASITGVTIVQIDGEKSCCSSVKRSSDATAEVME